LPRSLPHKHVGKLTTAYIISRLTAYHKLQLSALGVLHKGLIQKSKSERHSLEVAQAQAARQSLSLPQRDNRDRGTLPNMQQQSVVQFRYLLLCTFLPQLISNCSSTSIARPSCVPGKAIVSTHTELTYHHSWQNAVNEHLLNTVT
jgi:hypothetical protein